MNGTPPVRKAPLCIATTAFHSVPVLRRKCFSPLRIPASSERGSRKLIIQPGRRRWSDFRAVLVVYAPDYRRNHGRNQAVAGEGRKSNREGFSRGPRRAIAKIPPPGPLGPP